MTPEQEVSYWRDKAKELESKLYQQRRATAAVRVDMDRQVKAALDRSASCDNHGEEIQYLRHTASWYWGTMNDAEQARQAMIVPIMLTLEAVKGRSAPVPVKTLAEWLEGFVKAHRKAVRRPPSFPSLADCQRAGGCGHAGLCDGVAREIAGALGLKVAP